MSKSGEEPMEEQPEEAAAPKAVDNEVVEKTAPQASLTVVTAEDFNAVDVEGPIAGDRSVLSGHLGPVYTKAANAAAKEGNVRQARVYGLLGAIASMHHRAHDKGEPYGPMLQMEDRRSIIPDDLRGEHVDVLAGFAAGFKNAGLRARIADIVWLNDRKRGDMAALAITSILEASRRAKEGKADLFRGAEAANVRNMGGLLRRACQIAYARKWKDPEGEDLKQFISSLVQDAVQADDERPFEEFGELGLDYGIVEAATLGPQAEKIAAKAGLHPDTSRNLWELAARAYHADDKKEDNERCLKQAAECYVTMAEGMSGMARSSWFMDAIKALRRIPGTKERRKALEVKLREAQADVFDEMRPISVDIDLTELVDHARKVVAGKTLAEAFLEIARFDGSPSRTSLEEQAKKGAAGSIAAIIPATIYDDDGKVVAQSPGLSAGDDGNEQALRHLISQNEGYRRQTIAVGMIESARRIVNAEHPLGFDDFRPLMEMSPFVPLGYAALYATGFARFFTGDFVSALHILVPQLENSLRYVLRQAAVDSSAIQNDMTQENRTLPVMLDKDRAALEKIFGEAIIFEIENLFDYRGGPSLRHQLSHGLLGLGGSRGPDAVYACWFIFRLCCLPLFQDWNEVIKVYEAVQGKEPDQAGTSGTLEPEGQANSVDA